jgi:hypothetical protein
VGADDADRSCQVLGFVGVTVVFLGLFVMLVGVTASMAPLPSTARDTRAVWAVVLLAGAGMLVGGPNLAAGSPVGAILALSGTVVIGILAVAGVVQRPQAAGPLAWLLVAAWWLGAAVAVSLVVRARACLAGWPLRGPGSCSSGSSWAEPRRMQ